MKKIIIFLILIAMLGAGYREWTPVQIAVHEAAETMREAGYTDDHPTIQGLKAVWNEEIPKMETADILEPANGEGVEFEQISAENEALPPWEQFNLLHPGYNYTAADFYTDCEMVTKELGDAQRDGEYDIGVAILIARIPVNRTLYCEEFPDTITECITQRGQYNPAYYTSEDQGYPEHVKQAVTYAFLMDTYIPPELSMTGESMDVPRSLFYHGNYLTGGFEFTRTRVRTSGGYSATLVFGMDPNHYTDKMAE